MLGKHVPAAGRQGHGAVRAAGLRGQLLQLAVDTLDRLDDPQRSRFEVDVLPPQAARLCCAGARA